MRISTFKKYRIVLAGAAVMFATLFACTYDYFEDENNFLVYVPQIKEGTIGNYYISFHDEAGKHVVTRTITLPLDNADMRNINVKEGILKFKLFPGNYHITSFANFTPEKITTGNPFDDSYKAETPCDPGDYPFVTNLADSYIVSKTNPRFLLTEATAFPLGHPQGIDPVETDMNDTTRFKGNVEFDFIGLPTEVSTIGITYKGVGTRLYFNGHSGWNTNNDRVYASYDVSVTAGATVSLYNNLLYPSAGCMTNKQVLTRSVPADKQPLELEITLYGNNGSVIGIIYFTKEDFLALANDKKPVDENGNPLTSLVLEPRKTIKFTFKDFLVISIQLTGWGDTTHGEVSPT